MMVQLFLGERADAARSVECAWLKNVMLESDLEEGEAEAPILDLPEICLPAQQKDGRARSCPGSCFLRSLARVAAKKAFARGTGYTVALEGPDVKGAHHEHAVLFSGKDTHSQEHLWQVPVSERAYHHAIKKGWPTLSLRAAGEAYVGKHHILNPRCGCLRPFYACSAPQGRPVLWNIFQVLQ